MITEYFWPQVDDMELEDMWFQQDDAASHTANVKSMVYANKPATIDEHRTNIEREITAVSADLCLNFIFLFSFYLFTIVKQR